MKIEINIKINFFMPIYLTPIDAQLKEDEVYSGKVELLKIKIKMIKNK